MKGAGGSSHSICRCLCIAKSKRVKIKDREGLKKKIKDGRKKNKKLAKKNPQWKSSMSMQWTLREIMADPDTGLKKDPGVPNSFPFKDMIIAEAEQAKALVSEVSGPRMVC